MKPKAAIMIEISPGELIDRITILEIKAERIGDAAKSAAASRLLAVLRNVREECLPADSRLDELTATLKQTNERIWDVEDELRSLEGESRFDDSFVQLARSVYKLNDRRAALKRRVDDLLGSDLAEVKSYPRDP
jgi:predicted  nucleic acid-binding Zn-ribbon protein